MEGSDWLELDWGESGLFSGLLVDADMTEYICGPRQRTVVVALSTNVGYAATRAVGLDAVWSRRVGAVVAARRGHVTYADPFPGIEPRRLVTWKEVHPDRFRSEFVSSLPVVGGEWVMRQLGALFDKANSRRVTRPSGPQPRHTTHRAAPYQDVLEIWKEMHSDRLAESEGNPTASLVYIEQNTRW